MDDFQYLILQFLKQKIIQNDSKMMNNEEIILLEVQYFPQEKHEENIHHEKIYVFHA